MENIDPLFKKMRIYGQKTDLFFQNRGHADFIKTDPFSVKFRTMMRTLKQLDRGPEVVDLLVALVSPANIEGKTYAQLSELLQK